MTLKKFPFKRHQVLLCKVFILTSGLMTSSLLGAGYLKGVYYKDYKCSSELKAQDTIIYVSSDRTPNRTFPMTDETCNLLLYPSQGQCEIQRYDFLTLVKSNDTSKEAGRGMDPTGNMKPGKIIKPTKKPCPNKWFPLPVFIITAAIWGLIAVVSILSLLPVRKKIKQLIVSLVGEDSFVQFCAGSVYLFSCVPLMTFLLMVAFGDHPCTLGNYKQYGKINSTHIHTFRGPRNYSSFDEYLKVNQELGLVAPSKEEGKTCGTLTTWFYQDILIGCGTAFSFLTGSVCIYLGVVLRKQRNVLEKECENIVPGTELKSEHGPATGDSPQTKTFGGQTDI